MSGYSFDANIIIDSLAGSPLAHSAIARAWEGGSRAWISRMAWVEVMSKGAPGVLVDMAEFLDTFAVDELDADIAARAAALRRERPRLKSPDAIILASALARGRTLVTRNTKDFPPGMPGILVPYIL